MKIRLFDSANDFIKLVNDEEANRLVAGGVAISAGKRGIVLKPNPSSTCLNSGSKTTFREVVANNQVFGKVYQHRQICQYW